MGAMGKLSRELEWIPRRHTHIPRVGGAQVWQSFPLGASGQGSHTVGRVLQPTVWLSRLTTEALILGDLAS